MDGIRAIKKLLMIQSLTESADQLSKGDEEMNDLFLEILRDAANEINRGLDPRAFVEALVKMGGDDFMEEEKLKREENGRKEENPIDKKH